MPPHLLRKGQLQIGESMMVIMILLVIAVFALVFVANNAKEKYDIKLTENQELDAVETARLVTQLYELKCSREGMTTTCVDVYKAQALGNLIDTNKEAYDYYYNMFKNAKIALYDIYPGTTNYTIYEVNASTNTSNQKSKALIIPVSIHNVTTDTVSFGILSIERYHKTGRVI